MALANELQTFYAEMAVAMPLAKCQKCGCMHETLDTLTAALPKIEAEFAAELTARRAEWATLMQSVQYSCLGCDHCYAGRSAKCFGSRVSRGDDRSAVELRFSSRPQQHWPPMIGEYFVLDPAAPVAVSTLASVELAEQLAHRQPTGLAIVGKTETENIGLDKVIKNVITNPALRFLIVAGHEAAGHRSGQTFMALAAKGVDGKDASSAHPASGRSCAMSRWAEINAFRQQVQMIDLIGCENAAEIAAADRHAGRIGTATCSCSGSRDDTPAPVAISTVTTIAATESADSVVMDKAGYFVVVTLTDRQVINVEHYAYDDTLLHVVEGATRAPYHDHHCQAVGQ